MTLTRSITSCAAALCFATTAVAVAVPATAADLSHDRCPPGNSGYVLWDVSAQPYRADNAVDEAGNNDGFACAKPGGVFILDDGTPFQLYNFIDNKVVVPH
jgi:hypothetical protein